VILATVTFIHLTPTVRAYSDYKATVPAYSDDCYFSMCDHFAATLEECGTYYDCWTSTGVLAQYDTDNYPTYVEYSYADWWHQAASGGYWGFWTCLGCDYCINDTYHQYVQNYDDPLYYYIEPYFGWMRLDNWNSTRLNIGVYSVSSESWQLFYDPNDEYGVFHICDSKTTPWTVVSAWDD
jgi:hypothetical protein